ncbi:hypothetical protein K449DRAFT_433933 [Hypoxylon sp. EC38]|nr:hypothetical protein K449DRAFT_433933 [Hypoxylon sp. EC38]
MAPFEYEGKCRVPDKYLVSSITPSTARGKNRLGIHSSGSWPGLLWFTHYVLGTLDPTSRQLDITQPFVMGSPSCLCIVWYVVFGLSWGLARLETSKLPAGLIQVTVFSQYLAVVVEVGGRLKYVEQFKIPAQGAHLRRLQHKPLGIVSASRGSIGSVSGDAKSQACGSNATGPPRTTPQVSLSQAAWSQRQSR